MRRAVAVGALALLTACIPTSSDLVALKDQGCREQGGRPASGYCLSRPDTTPDWRQVRDCGTRLRGWAAMWKPGVDYTDRQFQVACGGL